MGTGGDTRGGVRTVGVTEREPAEPRQLVDFIKADWLVNEAQGARVLAPTSLLSSSSSSPLPLLQRDNKEADE